MTTRAIASARLCSSLCCAPVPAAFIYYNSFPTSPVSVAKESTAVEKCVRQPWSWREAQQISTVISLLIHLIVDVKKCVCRFFVRMHKIWVYMRPLVSSRYSEELIKESYLFSLYTYCRHKLVFLFLSRYPWPGVMAWVWFCQRFLPVKTEGFFP